MAMAVASTVVLIRVLTDNRVLDTPAGHVAVGWLIVEDILTVIVLVLIPAWSATGRRGDGMPRGACRHRWLTLLIRAAEAGGAGGDRCCWRDRE